MIYSNIIEEVKTKGTSAADIRVRYETLDLVPANILPNPDGSWIINKSLDKIDKFRKALVDIVRTRAAQLVRELNFDVSLSVTFQVTLGVPPSVAVSVQPGVTAARSSAGA